MDGNGRWAKAKGRARTFGHIKGTRVAKKIITRCSRLKIKYLTLYAFSTENWLRPQSEVSLLMTLLSRYLKKETENLVKENIRFDVIGDISKVPSDVAEQIVYAKTKTSHCTGLNVIFALSYGSRQEIAQAMREIAVLVKENKILPQQINEALINEHLQTFGIPDPDLIIRTSGEKRLSNFLMWQAAYSEFYFSDKLWPDFTENDLDQAILNYSQRERRFGNIQLSEDAAH